MTKPIYTDDDIQLALSAADGNKAEAARALGISRSTFRSRLACIAEKKTVVVDKLSITPPPSPEMPIDELLEWRERRFEQIQVHEEGKLAIPVTVRDKGPIGLLCFGDPHVDDDGCDIKSLRQHVNVINNTDGMYGCNVGDTTNNWVGRLARLYAEQETTANQAWMLAEWFLTEVQKWLFIVGGNHDCHDTETEVWTKRGWLRYDDINFMDETLGLTPQGSAEWQPIQDIVVRKHVGPMVSVETNQLNLMVTPNHRVLCRRAKSGKGYQFERAQDILGGANVCVPATSLSKCEKAQVPEAIIRLAGWFLTDGYLSRDKRSHGYTRVRFCQSKDITPIVDLCTEAGLSYSLRVRERNIVSICGTVLKQKPLPQQELALNTESSRAFLRWCPTKRVPQWAYRLDDEQFQWFLDAIIDGDGSRHKHTDAVVLYGRPEFLDEIQGLCHSHGWRATRSSHREGTDHRLNISRRDECVFWPTKSAREVEGYDGDVWCLVVPHQNFLVRREGKAHFSGNCWSGAGDPIKWIARKGSALYQMSTARLCLTFPNKKDIYINCRHDFPGTSMWNPAHGPMRAAKHGFHDHLMLAGHRHVSAYGLVVNPADGTVSHCVRVAGYKVYDKYAEEKGLPRHFISPSVVAVIDPTKDECGLITIFHDVEAAADYLTWARGRT